MNDKTQNDTGNDDRLADAEAVQTDWPRERLIAVGPAKLSDAELLALLLGTASTETPRALLAALGGLRGLAEADEAELRSTAQGIGAARAATIQAALELGRRSVGERPFRGQRIKAASDVWAHFRARLSTSPVEEFWCISLDVRHRVLSDRCIARGSLTGVGVHPRDVFRPLIRESAAAAIFCHNHPSGDPTPSTQDIVLTKRLREVGELCGIALLDHVVVAADGYVSISERGWA